MKSSFQFIFAGAASLVLQHSVAHSLDYRGYAGWHVELPENVADMKVHGRLLALEYLANFPGAFGVSAPEQYFLLAGRQVDGVMVGVGRALG
jgi:hypothetical protein